MSQFKTILLATDFSDGAEKAASLALSLAKLAESKLYILYVAVPVSMATGFGFSTLPGMADLETIDIEIETEAKKRIEKLAQHYKEKYGKENGTQGLSLNIETLVEQGASPEAVIIDKAEELHADLIVAGTHGRGAFSRMLAGSTAEHLVRVSPIPVLTARIDDPQE